MIRTMIVDDDALVRLGLVELMSSDTAIEVVAEAADGAEAVDLATARSVDVVLMDLRMPRLDGIKATAALRVLPHPPRVIVLTTFDIDVLVYDSLAAGADGFLLKDAAPEEILRAVHLVAAGSSMLHPRAARRVIDRYHRTPQTRVGAARRLIAELTPREHSVLAHLADGASNSEIARRLAMQESTVKAHVSRILKTLEVSNRVQAAIIARDAAIDAPR